MQKHTEKHGNKPVLFYAQKRGEIMQTTENYGFRKPESTDFYNVEDMNYNADVMDAKLKEIEAAADPQALGQHTNNKENPHGVTKGQVGLGNVPNVATNDQTPTYTVPSADAELSSGEKLSVAFGKIAKAVKSLIAHIADSTSHVTSTEKSAWNAKAGTGTATTSANGLMSKDDKSKLNGIAAGAQVNSITGVKGNAESSYRTGNVNITPANIGAAPSSHNQAASTITAGTFAGKVQANATAAATVTNAQVRDIYAGTSDMTAGTTALTSGTIYVMYE